MNETRARHVGEGPPLQPVSILIAALGGEGGGVLADWIVQAALAAGLPVQATSVPGVAQRTGATSYYIEFMPEAGPAGAQPVFALMPVPGRVDTLLASEILEGVRMIERGFVTPDRTWLITATHRVLTTAEKMAMGDGRFDDAKLIAAAHALSARCLALDLQAIAAAHRTVVSAVMFGALAGAGRLPWPRGLCEAVIEAGGIGVAASLAGFAAAYDAAASAASDRPSRQAPTNIADAVKGHDAGAAASLAETMRLGEARVLDFQDAAYAQRYRERMRRLQSRAMAGTEAALEAAARHLALWMSYEDVIRVAALKIRRSRFQRVREDAAARSDNVLEIREHLKPGLEEIAAIAPAALGRRLRERALRAELRGRHPGKGITLHTTSIRGFASLRLLASLKFLRPRSLRWAEEQQAIESWLAALELAASRDGGLARQVAELPRLRKGYGDTAKRGLRAYEAIWRDRVVPWLEGGAAADAAAAQALEQAIGAALADPEHRALGQRLGRSVVEQPIAFHPRVSKSAQGPDDGRR